ncbi:nucleotidyl transferase AbiEii/AbiGii toxin family protein [Rhodococcus koreensis]|uniref:nucleotidyl transferase AbiEii/AbiGii toxin family protein n=1 Tax=Rhodococcus koreensis TaxID=99653 RepID=UPI003672F83A
MNLDERDSVADQFGVAPEQVERDHLISLLLAYLSEHFADRLHFIGGTALARTHLPNGRLSEDIDLIALDPRRSTLATDLDQALPRALQRAYGRLEWAPPLSAGSSVDAAALHTARGLSVKIQLLASTDRTLWPTEPRTLIQRYSDAPPARLLVPTLPAFAASKTATWCDRAAARDLWDLWALTNIGAINPDTAALFRKFGPTGKNPGTYVFTKPPSDNEWHTQLAGQTRLTITATEALHTVRTAWAHLTPHP